MTDVRNEAWYVIEGDYRQVDHDIYRSAGVDV